MYIINLDSVDGQTPGIGQKASNLGILMRSGFSVPKGFVVTSEAFEKFLLDTGISRELPGILASVDPEVPEKAVQAYESIKTLFQRVSGNDFLIRELRDAYSELCFGKDANVAGGAVLGLVRAGRTESFVSVRPSPICQSTVSFSGHGKPMLNQISYKQILSAVKDCWLSVFSPESLVYRKLHGIEDFGLKALAALPAHSDTDASPPSFNRFSMCVIIQRMVDSELSGTLFTSDPVSGQKDNALVEGFWGLGETLCCGCLSPDQYIIQKDSGGLVSKKVSKKLWLRRRGPLSGNTIQEKVPMSKVYAETLSEKDFPRFASIAKKLEEVFGCPQEVEWGVERGRVVLLQSKPIVFSKLQPPAQDDNSNSALPLQVREPKFSGLGLSAGTANGIAYTWREGMARPESPGILVTKNLGMELLPYIRWFSGIVSEQGGSGSCMASLGRELGIPMVSGIENATVLLAGKEVILDGGKGVVYSPT